MPRQDSAYFSEIQSFVEQCRQAKVLRIDGQTVVSRRLDGRQTLFSVKNPADYIQKAHFHGVFFEPEELSVLKTVLPKGAVYVDIGANIGNHALYVAQHLAPARIIPFEPNRPAIQILVENIALNGLFDLFDLSHLGLGLAATSAEGFGARTVNANNLGMTAMVEGGGDIPLITGDAALAGEARIDLIKMDVEGMEMGVLAGLTETLARTRPQILIEVDDGNRAAFDAWLGPAGYRIAETFRKMAANQNFLLVPG